MVKFEDILEAQRLLRGVIHRTEFAVSKAFSDITGSSIYLKTENLQKTGSFKIRGAYNKIAKLTDEEREKGIVAVSAGNHAQGVAHAASLFGVRSVIVMPEYAPIAKMMATKNYGAEVILRGKNLEQARDAAMEIASDGMIFIHPYDDPDIVAGQGTIGLEMLEDVPDLDAIIVPVGGGGLISGIAAAVKNINPSVRIIGVEAEGYNSLKLSLENDKKVDAEGKHTLADGIAVKVAGELPFSIAREMVDQVVVVSDNEVSSAILWLLERSKLVVEGAGAAALAAFIAKKVNVSGKIGVVLTGGNIDLNMLQLIIDKGLIKQGRRVELRVVIPDKPGQLKGVLELLNSLGVNIYSILHDRIKDGISPGYAEVDMVLDTRDKEHTKSVVEKIQTGGYEVRF